MLVYLGPFADIEMAALNLTALYKQLDITRSALCLQV